MIMMIMIVVMIITITTMILKMIHRTNNNIYRGQRVIAAHGNRKKEQVRCGKEIIQKKKRKRKNKQ